MGTVQRFLRLDPRLRRLTAAAALLQIAARLMIAVGGIRAALGWTDRLSRTVGPNAIDAAEAADALARAARNLPGTTCLTQALAARMLLGRCHPDARLVIGVRGRVPDPEFHAWLELPDRSIPSDPAGDPFLPLFGRS